MWCDITTRCDNIILCLLLFFSPTWRTEALSNQSESVLFPFSFLCLFLWGPLWTSGASCMKEWASWGTTVGFRFWSCGYGPEDSRLSVLVCWCSLPPSAEGPGLESWPGVRLRLTQSYGGANLLGSAEGENQDHRVDFPMKRDLNESRRSSFVHHSQRRTERSGGSFPKMLPNMSCMFNFSTQHNQKSWGGKKSNFMERVLGTILIYVVGHSNLVFTWEERPSEAAVSQSSTCRSYSDIEFSSSTHKYEIQVDSRIYLFLTITPQIFSFELIRFNTKTCFLCALFQIWSWKCFSLEVTNLTDILMHAQ